MKKGQKFYMAHAVSPTTLPKNMKLYYLIINLNGGRLKRQIKRYVLQPLLSVAEVIANW